MIEIRFVLTSGEVVTVASEEGISVMEAAVRNSVPGIAAECGGCLSCGTCHAHLSAEFAGRIPPPGEMESAMLDNVIDPRPGSRLTCQVILTPALNGAEFRIPEGGY